MRHAARRTEAVTDRPLAIGAFRRAGPVVVLLLAALTVGARPAAAAPAAGTVSVDLYRPGAYAMQATWTWCTAAGVQIMRNIAVGQADHSAANQRRYFDYMRARDRYVTPVREGVDPQGFRAGLRQFVDSRYAIVASTTYDGAVRSAVTRLRRSGLPVALIVDAGRHAWVLTGFTATADPALTSTFRVISLRIVGPLYGRQSLNGYDPPPDTGLSYDTFRRYLLPYHFPFGATPWDRRYVTFQAIPSPSASVGAPETN
jgi:hypothetical protein